MKQTSREVVGEVTKMLNGLPQRAHVGFLPLSRHFGSWTLSSSDGQRFPAAVKTRNATALPRYFGLGKGLTFFSWTSDQFSQYGSKVAPSTSRDATYVLDEILDNETELPIAEHATDTAG
jgi:TnpA family transposase